MRVARVLDGGALLGRGKHGATFTVASGARGDPDTLHALLGRLRGEGRLTSVELHYVTPDYKETQRVSVSQEAALDALAAFLGDPRRTGGYIAKRFIDATAEERRESFASEVAAVLDIASAFGADAHAATTLGVPRYRGRNLLAIHALPADEYFIFSERCGPPLDKFKFTDSNIDKFVDDILKGFAVVHGAGMIHGDVKLDNMIYCEREDRFKLIDWGLAEPVRKLRARYLGHRKPKNYGSPMSWYVWGLWRRVSWATYLGYYLFKWSRKFVKCDQFRAFLLQAGRSFDEHMATPARSGQTRRASSRSALLARHAQSFDLFNLGVIMAGLATCSGYRLHAATRGRLLSLATRMTHYGAENFVGSAVDARRAWREAQ